MNVSELLHSKKYYVSDKKRFNIINDVAAALSYLFSNKIVHNNLKSTNILV